MGWGGGNNHTSDLAPFQTISIKNRKQTPLQMLRTTVPESSLEMEVFELRTDGGCDIGPGGSDPKVSFRSQIL